MELQESRARYQMQRSWQLQKLRGAISVAVLAVACIVLALKAVGFHLP